jgi:hypothetical protein
MKKLQSCLIALVCSVFLCSHSASGQTGELWEQTGTIIPCQTSGPDLETTFQYINHNVGGAHGGMSGEYLRLSTDHETISQHYRKWDRFNLTFSFPITLMDCRTLVKSDDVSAILFGCKTGSDSCAASHGESRDDALNARTNSSNLIQKDEDIEGALRLAKAMSHLVYLLQQEYAAKSQSDPFAH